MRTRTLRCTAAVSAAALVLASMLSCSTSNNSPSDPTNPSGGGPQDLAPPVISAITPSESCATAGNLITIEGEDLVDPDFLASVTINGVPATVQDRFDAGASGTDILTVATPAMAVPASGQLVDVRVTTANGADTVTGGLKLFPGCSGAPILVSISPSTGARSGFEPIQLIGDNLGCLTSVQFVSTTGTTVLSAEIMSVTSDQSVTVLSPANIDPSSAPYQIVVTSQCGTNAAPRPTFQYIGSGNGGTTLPDATAIQDVATSLPSGPAVGGNQVRISGRDLNLATEVRIGTNVLTLENDDFVITANGDIIIAAMPASPLGASTTVPISVTVASADGPDPTPVTYTYVGVGQPNCVSISPNSGPIEGGTRVTITGLNLNDVDQVTFGGVAADQVFYPTADGSQLVVLSPAFPVPVDVDIALQISNGTTFTTIDTCTPSRFTYIDVNTQPPFSVADIVPAQGPQTGGTTIVISGTGLDSVSSVMICGVAATITSAVSEQVQATTGLFDGTVPATCDVVVNTSTGLSATLEGGFTYRPVVPDAQAFAGDSARTAPQAGGTFFRLQGVNLIGVTDVGFGGSQSANRALACDIDVQSNTQVSGTVPAYLTPGAAFPASVSVVAESAAGVDSTPLTFTYYANPVVTDARGPLNDDRIQSNERVVLIGSNFRPVNDVFVGEIEISNSGITGNGAAGSETATLGPSEFTVVNNGRIEFDFPSSLQVEDYYDVTIRTPRQTADCVSAYEDTAVRTLFLGSRPVTNNLSPSIGPWSGGTTVTITGTFNVPVTRVTFCGVDQSIVPASQTDTSIKVVTRSTGSEANAGTPCDVVVYNASGGSDPVTGAFTFVPQPDLTSVEVTTQNCGLRSSTSGIVPVTEGQVLTLRGSDFGLDTTTGVNKVLIGGVAASITSNNRADDRIDVFVPAAPAGGPRFTVQAVVDFPVDTDFTAQLPLVVDYQDTPTITSVTPPTSAAGTNVTIAGTNLRNVDGTPSVVTFGGTVATVLTTTDTSLVVVVPPGTPGATVSVLVTTCQGQATSTFTYPCPIPRITSFSPATGAPPGQVTITGTDLIVNGQTPVVQFGGTDAVVQMGSSTPTSLVVDIPAGTAGSRASITVATCGGTATSASQFTYTCSAPALTNVTPGFGLPGTSVTLSGSFDNAGNPPTVLFGATPAATLTSFTATQIVVPAPPGSGTVNVTVQTCGGSALQVNGFTYCVTPNATSVAPTTGAPGAIIVVSGTNLQDPNGTPPTVTFTSGAQTANATVVASSSTALQVQVPSGLTGVATVTVTTCGGSDSAGTFQYCTTPTITSFSPAIGGTGTQVTIIGSNLIGANNVPATIRFGGVDATNVIQQTATQFIVTAPAGPSGQVVVDATTCGGTGQATALFSYCTQPVVSGINPTNGAAGDEVTIFGTGLIGANGQRGTVAFGTTAATVIDALPDGSQMTVVAPAGSFTQGQSVNVRVTTCGGVSATSATTLFTYQTSTTCVAPTVANIAPTSGAAGSQLTVTGTNLIGNDGNPGVVRFGGTTATLIAATPTQLAVTVPAGAGTVGVSVQTCGGTAQSSTLFTYCATPTLNLVNGVTPSSGATDSTVILRGTNLLGANGANPTVTFGTFNAAIIDQTPTQLTVTAPAGPTAGTTVSVKVTTCGGASNTLPFQYVSTTQFDVTAITPTSGPNTGGQVVSITGTGLNGTGVSDIQGIQICDVNVSSFTQVSDTLVQATTAAFNGAVPATCDVEVILNDGRQDTLVGGYTYLPPVPDGQVFDEAGAFSINAPKAGGTTFRIIGTNLIGVNTINFGGFAGNPTACNIQVASDTQVTGIAPAYATPISGTSQSVEVFVQSDAGVDPTTVEVAPSGSGVLFKYWPNPTLSGATQPPLPNAANNRTITMTGSSFGVTTGLGFDQFIAPTITIKNLGITDPTNFPAGTVFNFTVPIRNVTPTSFQFDFPDVSLGDIYSVTITTPNQGAACVDTYSDSLAAVFVAAENNCADFTDNDQDGLIDCADGDCTADPACP